MPMITAEILKDKLFFIGGPCVAESYEICRQTAEFAKSVCERLGITYIFKSSYDKANRSSVRSYRGPGIKEGLEILKRIKEELHIPVLTDIHHPEEAELCAEVVDIIQIPALLCRQTDLLTSAGKTGKWVNIKKGQFMAPWDMRNAVEKVRSTGNDKVILTERGTTFGYNNLVNDMRSLVIMKQFCDFVVFDATHSVQIPGGLGSCSGGQREFIAPLARAAAGAGIDGIFMEIHPDPDKALCDGPNSLPLNQLEQVLREVKRIHEFVKEVHKKGQRGPRT